MAVPTAVLPFLPRIAASLRVSFVGGRVRKVRWVVSGEERRSSRLQKATLSKGVRGSAVFGGPGGRRACRGDESPRPISQARSRSCVVLSSISRTQSRSGFPSLSFAEAVALPRANNDSKVECVSSSDTLVWRSGSKEGFPAVCFSSKEVQAGVEKFQFALVLKFHPRRPPAKELQLLISSKWGGKGRFSFSEIWDDLHVIVNLESEADVQKGLSCKVRKVGSCGFKIFRWNPDSDPLKAPSSLRRWIRLPGVPLFLYDKAFAKIIVASFAKLLSVDADSELCRNLSQMRLCVVPVEGVMIPEKIWVQLPDNRSYWQFIEMEDSQNSTRNVAERISKCMGERHGEDGNSGSVLIPDFAEERDDNCVTVDEGDNLVTVFREGADSFNGETLVPFIEIDSPIGGLAAVPGHVNSTGGDFNGLSKAVNNISVIGYVDHAPNEAANLVRCSTPVKGLEGDGEKAIDMGVGCSAAMRNKDMVSDASEWQTRSYGRKKRSGSRKEANSSGLPSSRMGSIAAVTAVIGHAVSNKGIVPAGASKSDMCPAAVLNGKEFIADGPISPSKEQEVKSSRERIKLLLVIRLSC